MRIVKWLFVIGVIVFAWKVGLPWLKQQGSPAKSASSGSAGSPCERAAESASEAWGSGLGRFVNPPYDADAWSSFKSGVDSKIADADRQCGCIEPSCAQVRGALSDLRGLVSEFDSAIRNGTPAPEDAVQRQAAIDERIATAK